MAQHIARTSMLIHRPVAEVFDAFVNPATITKFWLASTSGRLAEGAEVEWHFMVPGAVATVQVTALEENKRIAFEWQGGGGTVDMVFEAHGVGAAHLAVEAAGLKDENEVVDSTGGFTIVLCDLKTLLETGRSANLVKDKAALIAATMNRTG